jgi:5-formyltetrahydrofolate cyclo-ligase
MANFDLSLIKKEIRTSIRQQKKLLSPEEILRLSQHLLSKVEMLDCFVRANTVLAYWSLPDEVHTHDFVLRWHGVKKIVLPVVAGNDLELRVFEGLNAMAQSRSFGIMEPVHGELVSPENIDFALIPGVAFDRMGNRLGRGKGFYDRILHRIGACKVAVGYPFQLVGSVPVEGHDAPVDLVICN